MKTKEPPKADFLTYFDLLTTIGRHANDKAMDVLHEFDRQGIKMNDILDIIPLEEAEKLGEKFSKEIDELLEKKKGELLEKKKDSTFQEKIRKGYYGPDNEGD